jgi:hypothetical protein
VGEHGACCGQVGGVVDELGRRVHAGRGGACPDEVLAQPAGERSICSRIETARRRQRAMSCAVKAFCQLLPMILCRSARRSASPG